MTGILISRATIKYYKTKRLKTINVFAHNFGAVKFEIGVSTDSPHLL